MTPGSGFFSRCDPRRRRIDPWPALALWAVVQAVLSYLRRSTVPHYFVTDGLARLWIAPLPATWAAFWTAASAAWWIVLAAAAIRWGRPWAAALRDGWRAPSSPMPPEPRRDPSDAIPLAVPVGVVAALVVYAAAHPFSINWDCAYLLRAGEVILDGGAPYRDFVDANPPLVMYLMALPVVLARALGIHAFTGFNLFTIGLVAASLGASRRLLAAAPEPIRSCRDWLLVPYALFQLLLAHQGEFGQREHLFILLATPAFLCRWLRWEGIETPAVEAAALGFVAGVGMLIKPHFLMLPLAMEAVWFLARGRRIRAFLAPEVAAALIAAAGYAALFALGPESLRTEYLGRWFPFYLNHYNDVFGGVPAAWRVAPNLVIPAALAVLAARFSPGPAARLVLGLFAGTVGAWGAFVAQKKGFSYHIIPYAALGLLAAGVVSSGAARRWTSWKAGAAVSPRVVALVVAAAIFAWPVLPGAWPERRRLAHEKERRAVIEKLTVPGDGVLILSPAMIYAFPLVPMLERRTVTRFACLDVLGGLYDGVRTEPGAPFPYRTPETATPDERRFLADLAADVARDRPKLVMIEHNAWCQGCPPGFDVFDYFRAAGFVDAALADYRLLGMIPEFAVFALPPATAAPRD